MKFHVIGNTTAPKMILIHGMLTPWTVWTPQIEHFSKNYCIIVPELDGHEIQNSNEFVSIEKEAELIERYCLENNYKQIFALCGLSMGGAIAHLLWKRGKISVKNLILDGAPLVPANALLNKAMTSNYLNIAKNSKKRDAKVIENFKKYFLPEKYLDDYLAFIDHISENSIKNMIKTVSASRLIVDGVSSDTNLVYLHGTAYNEYLSKKSVKLINKHYPAAKIITFKGDPHCYKAIYKPDEWIASVEDNLI